MTNKRDGPAAFSENPLDSAEQHSVDLSELRLDHEICCREKLHAGRIKQLRDAVRAGASLGDLVVAEIEGAITLIDGYHRVEALKAAGESLTDVLHLGQMDHKQAQWLACELHWHAALPLRPGERRAGFKKYVRAGRNQAANGRLKSYRSIAAELGLPKSSIERWMKRFFPAIAAKMGREPEEEPREPDNETARFEAKRAEIEEHIAQAVLAAQAPEGLRSVCAEALREGLRRLAQPAEPEEALGAHSDDYDF